MLETEIGTLWEAVLDLNTTKAAIAFSGGGDSTALLHMLRDHPHVTHALVINHNLRTESAEETQKAADYARALGYRVKTQKWINDGPKTGVQVKARAFRYAAMGQICREDGITHLLTAHTKDDQAETLLMRQDRQTGWRGLAGMRAKAYGPLWPALADVNLVRPLLNISRKELRSYNKAHSLTWVEDPSNENLDFARIRARKKLSQDKALRDTLLSTQSEMSGLLRAERQELHTWMEAVGRLDPKGFFIVSDVPPSELLLHLLRIASGSGGPIDSARRDALRASMASPDFKAATLGGAWIIKHKDGFLITRDKVAVRGRENKKEGSLEPMFIPPVTPLVWDGRFRIYTNHANITVQPAYGILQKLREVPETKALFDLPENVRSTLPVFTNQDEILGFGAGEWAGVTSVSLATPRLQALWA